MSEDKTLNEGNEENEEIKVGPDATVKIEKPNSGSNFYRQKITDVQGQLDQMKAENESLKTQQLTEKENFKELYELEKGKRVEAETKSKSIAENYFNGLKTTAVREVAIKSGILDEAISDINIKDNPLIQTETTSTGNVNIIGADDYIEQLKANKPHWFRKSGAPIVNNANPEAVNPKTLSVDDIIKLEKTDPAKYQAEMAKRLKLVK